MSLALTANLKKTPLSKALMEGRNEEMLGRVALLLAQPRDVRAFFPF